MNTKSLSLPSRSMMRDKYLWTNHISGQPSASNLRIDFCTSFSRTSHKFRTIVTYEELGPRCSASYYRHRTPADCSRSLQLRKNAELEERDTRELLKSLSQHSVGRLTSRMTAQGAVTASNNVLVTEHVLAS